MSICVVHVPLKRKNKFNLLTIQYHVAYLTPDAGITCGSLGAKRKRDTVSIVGPNMIDYEIPCFCFKIVMMISSFIPGKYSQNLDFLMGVPTTSLNKNHVLALPKLP